jgi:hypothetical protein
MNFGAREGDRSGRNRAARQSCWNRPYNLRSTMEKAYRIPDYMIDAIGDRWPFSDKAITLQMFIDRITAFRKAPVQEYVANDGSRVWVDRRGYVYGSDV